MLLYQLQAPKEEETVMVTNNLALTALISIQSLYLLLHATLLYPYTTYKLTQN